MEDKKKEIIVQTNDLLSKLGFGSHSFDEYNELVESISSMSVACYERMFEIRLNHIERMPDTKEQYQHNAQIVIDALLSAWLLPLNYTLKTLDGKSICDGNVESIQQLITIFQQAYDILHTSNRKNDIKEEMKEEKSSSQEKKNVSFHIDAVDNSPEAKSDPNSTINIMKRQMEVNNTTTDSNLRLNQSEESISIKKQQQIRPIRRTLSDNGSATPKRSVQKLSVEHSRSNQKSRIRKATSNQASPVSVNMSRKASPPSSIYQTPPNLIRKSRNTRTLQQKNTPRSSSSSRSRKSRSDSTPLSYRESSSSTPLRSLLDSSPIDSMYFDHISSVSRASDSIRSMSLGEHENEHHTDTQSQVENVSLNNGEIQSLEIQNSYQTPPPKQSNLKYSNTIHADENINKKKLERSTEDEDLSKENDKLHQNRKKANTKSLYPLTPQTNDEKELLRYKLLLKDHLQELRHREYCELQNMKRAYNANQHAATVEKIRMRRFQEDLRLNQLSTGLEEKQSRQLQLRRTLQKILQLEKEKLRQQQKMTSQVVQEIQREHVSREVELRTFYANQMALVKQQTIEGMKERELVEQAHRAASTQRLREIKHEQEEQLNRLVHHSKHMEEAKRYQSKQKRVQWRNAQISDNNKYSAKIDPFYTAVLKTKQLHARNARGVPLQA